MDSNNQQSRFEHHQLRIWKEVRELVRWVHSHRIQNAEVRNQASRAVISVALNVAEGAGQTGAAKKRHYRIAHASLVEVMAAYDIAQAIGERHPMGALTPLATYVGNVLRKLLRSTALSG